MQDRYRIYKEGDSFRWDWLNKLIGKWPYQVKDMSVPGATPSSRKVQASGGS